jgi:hypothetical protein
MESTANSVANFIENRELFSAIGVKNCDTFLHFGTTGVNIGTLVSAAAAAVAVDADVAKSVAVQTRLDPGEPKT